MSRMLTDDEETTEIDDELPTFDSKEGGEYYGLTISNMAK